MALVIVFVLCVRIRFWQNFWMFLYVFWRKTAGFDETELDELIDLEDFDCRLINELQWREIRNNSTHIDKKISGGI